MRTLIMLLFVAACGAETASPRCFTRDEALGMCVAHRIGESGESVEVASFFCSPNFQLERCYLIEETRR
jgi:hypothetical protein